MCFQQEKKLTVVNGVIQQIQTRSVSGGTKTAYDIYVNGQKYGAGLFAPKAKEGDYVTFEANQSQYGWDVVARTLRVGKAPDGEQAAPPVSRSAGGVPSFDKKQDAISRQAASNTAIAFMQLLAAQDALPVPASKSKGDKQAVLETLLQGYEKRFYEANTGQVWKDVSPAGSKQEVAASAPQVVEDSTWE